MDVESLQGQLRGFARPLAKVMLAVFVGLLLFELAEDFLWPDLPKWKSRAIEVIYAVILAGVVGYFALRMHNVLYQQVLEENEKYVKSEGDLIRNKEWFRSLTEHGSDLITVIDPQGAILYDSPSIERILGYRPIDRQGKSGFDLIHPEDIPGARSIIERAFRKLGSTHTIEMRVRGRDGRWHVFESTGKAMLDHEGKLRGVINSRDITGRKKTEQELLYLKTKFQTLFESSSDAVMLLDEKRFLDCNKSALAIFGCATREEFCSKHPADLSPVEQPCGTSSMVLANQQIATAFEKGSHHFEWVHTRADTGKTFSADVLLSAMNLDGKPVLQATVRDITERKQMEDALRKTQLQQQAILDNIPDIAWMKDASSKYIAANEAFAKSCGVKPEHMPGKTDLELWPKDLAERYRADDTEVVETGRRKIVQEPFVDKNGKQTWIETVKTPIRDDTGRIIGTAGIARDVTERKQIEEKLRLQTTALEAAANGIVITDRSGAIVWVNPAFTTLTGYSAGEALGQNPRLLKSGLQDPAFYATLWNAITSGRSWHGEIVNKRKDGTLYTEEQTITPVRDAQGEITHFIAIKRDITERKQMELQTKQLSRLAALGQLIGGIAHEMKNPLFILTGRIQMAREKLAQQEYADLGSDLEILDEAGRRMKTITDRFMTIAKPAPPRPERCSIQAVINQVLEFLANELMTNKIRMATDFAPDLPEICSDRHQLHEVFFNLMFNAMQAMSRAHGKGTLTISTTREADWIAVRIQDDGPGIPPEHRARLFDPFFSIGEQGKGPGLGLWIVRSTLMMLKGTVECESEVGKGTTFIVRLPITAPS